MGDEISGHSDGPRPPSGLRSFVANRLLWLIQNAMLAASRHLLRADRAWSPVVAARVNEIRRLASTAHKITLARRLREAGIRTVQSGPFTGMQLVSLPAAWGNGRDECPKLLGTYEAELHGVWTTLARRPPLETVINIGCAEGYYAVGLARYLSPRRVIAVDGDEQALECGRRNAMANQLQVPLEWRKAITPNQLQAILVEAPQSLVLSDCEGYEYRLFTPPVIAALRPAVVVIELHPTVDEAVATDAFMARFAASHLVHRYREGARDPNAFPALSRWGSEERWLAVSEGRRERMDWLVGWPKDK